MLGKVRAVHTHTFSCLNGIRIILVLGSKSCCHLSLVSCLSLLFSAIFVPHRLERSWTLGGFQLTYRVVLDSTVGCSSPNLFSTVTSGCVKLRLWVLVGYLGVCFYSANWRYCEALLPLVWHSLGPLRKSAINYFSALLVMGPTVLENSCRKASLQALKRLVTGTEDESIYKLVPDGRLPCQGGEVNYPSACLSLASKLQLVFLMLYYYLSR